MTCAYEYGVPADWQSGVAAFEVRFEEDEPVSLVGPCPRCHDTIGTTLVAEDGVSLVAEERRRFIVRCNCAQPHAGRPAGARGCGAYGGVSLR